MGELVIRDVDEETLARLVAQAAAQHQSLEERVREVLMGVGCVGRERERVPADDRDTWLDDLIAKVDRMAAMNPAVEVGTEDPLVRAYRLVRGERVAEVQRIRAMTSPTPSGVQWPTAESMVREDRDNNETYR